MEILIGAIVLLGLAGFACSYFWMLAMKKQLETSERTLKSTVDFFDKNRGDLAETLKENQKLSKMLLDFIDKNIKERVVHTDGYSNEDKVGYPVVDDSEDIQEEEVREIGDDEFKL